MAVYMYIAVLKVFWYFLCLNALRKLNACKLQPKITVELCLVVADMHTLLLYLYLRTMEDTRNIENV